MKRMCVNKESIWRTPVSPIRGWTSVTLKINTQSNSIQSNQSIKSTPNPIQSTLYQGGLSLDHLKKNPSMCSAAVCRHIVLASNLPVFTSCRRIVPYSLADDGIYRTLKQKPPFTREVVSLADWRCCVSGCDTHPSAMITGGTTKVFNATRC